jgi:hypothetical protein
MPLLEPAIPYLVTATELLVTTVAVATTAFESTLAVSTTTAVESDFTSVDTSVLEEHDANINANTDIVMIFFIIGF